MRPKSFIYQWGWITVDGHREKYGAASVLPINKIGVWGCILMDEVNTCYCETFLSEYKKDSGSWKERPWAMLQVLNKEQTMTLMRTTPSNELIIVPQIMKQLMYKRQVWKCSDCGHTFFTPIGIKNVLSICQLIKSIILRKPIKTKCQMCHKTAAIKDRVSIRKPREQ